MVLRSTIDLLLSQIPMDFGGGCSVSKANVLAQIIKSQRIARSLDIGVYRGRSFFPQAIAHQLFTGGKVIGVDPYDSQSAIEFDHPEIAQEIAEFAEHTDFEQIHSEVELLRTSTGLEDNSEIVRETSHQASFTLQQKMVKFGLIHIDGNHDLSFVNQDFLDYLPLLDERNGFLVFDDISWSSVKPVVQIASKRLTLMYSRVDMENDYAVFWTGKSLRKKKRLRTMIALAAEDEIVHS